MKRQLSAEGNYTEAELEEYMQSHKKLMIDSLWKLNVADIEATLSRVCQMVGWYIHEFRPFSYFIYFHEFIFSLRFYKIAMQRKRNCVWGEGVWRPWEKSFKWACLITSLTITIAVTLHSVPRLSSAWISCCFRGWRRLMELTVKMQMTHWWSRFEMKEATLLLPPTHQQKLQIMQR